MDTPIIWLINKVIAAAGKVITVLFIWLPDSPFQYVIELNNSWIGYINYIIPVPGIIAHMSLYITAVAIYYVVRIALRWVKGIS
jgi:hypothetical protein